MTTCRPPTAPPGRPRRPTHCSTPANAAWTQPARALITRRHSPGRASERALPGSDWLAQWLRQRLAGRTPAHPTPTAPARPRPSSPPPPPTPRKARPTSPAQLAAQLLRACFPCWQQQVQGQPLAYLDNAATTRTPLAGAGGRSTLSARPRQHPPGRTHPEPTRHRCL